ncbi:hypothetical protein [Hymenobacter jeongseonensis]|nr:hypothetical protein [Hymenobacter jeongseonensis]
MGTNTVDRKPLVTVDSAAAFQCFYGAVEADAFAVRRIAKPYESSLLPQISGWVKPSPTGPGSTVLIEYRLPRLVVAVISLGFLYAVGQVISKVLVENGSGIFSKVLLGLGCVPIVGLLYLVALHVPFWLEVRKSRPLFVRILSVQEIVAPQL